MHFIPFITYDHVPRHADAFKSPDERLGSAHPSTQNSVRQLRQAAETNISPSNPNPTTSASLAASTCETLEFASRLVPLCAPGLFQDNSHRRLVWTRPFCARRYATASSGV